jgi:hypothetical protein
MKVIKGTGHLTGVVVKKTKASPASTKRRLSCIKEDFVQGYKSVNK